MVLIRVYGWLSDLLGFRSKEVQFDGKLDELLSSLGTDLMKILEEGKVSIAINHEIERDLSRRVGGDDLIAIFPAFSGGSMRTGLVRGRIFPQEVLRELKLAGDVGAIVTFSGVVRRHSGDGEVEKIFYDCYPEIAEKELARIREEALKRFGLREALVLHRVGEVPSGEVALLIVTVSVHRKEAFEAAAWIVDEVKRSVAIWKKEVLSDGRERWIME